MNTRLQRDIRANVNFLPMALTAVSAFVAATGLLEAAVKLRVGARPELNDPALAGFLAHAAQASIGVIIIDSFLMMGLLVYFSILRHILIRIRPALELFANVAYGAALIFVCLTLIGDAMDGASALEAMQSTPSLMILRALIEGHVLLFGGIGSIVISFVTLSYTLSLSASALISKRFQAVGYVVAGLNLLTVPASFFTLDSRRFYSPDGFANMVFGIIPFIAWVVFSGIIVARSLAVRSTSDEKTTRTRSKGSPLRQAQRLGAPARP